MDWIDPTGAARLRLAYCLNLHPAEDLAEILAGIERITLPLRDRLAPPDRERSAFGVGLYLPGSVARRLASDERELERLERFLVEHALDPFTYNAFPYGGFHRSGLKADVFRPTWGEEERVEYTLAVARIAARLSRAGGHVSISTHSGAFGAWISGEADLERCAGNMARVAGELARIEREEGVRIVLALEAEPRASAGDLAALARFHERVRAWCGDAETRAALDRHLGTCLDACHSAVEFEDPADAVRDATAHGPLGKLQFSSALALRDPGRNAAGRARLLALDEPRYLHQVTGRAEDARSLVRCVDLPELGRHVAAGDASWLACGEWRCHFHVPVDLERIGAAQDGLATTREHADRVLSRALAAPERWGVGELHVEIETYTWDVLPGAARGAGDMVDGLEREYRHVMRRLTEAGWRRSS